MEAMEPGVYIRVTAAVEMAYAAVPVRTGHACSGKRRQRTTSTMENGPDMPTPSRLKDDNVPPLQWKMGRICQLHPGTDGIARVASVRTQNGVIRRAFSKLCPLVSAVMCESA
ncbi:methyltransferase (DUF5641) [Popillia japonica]|uniref:Methyltransferase (DUF5641) n=1 Tax=Popillia japonica TaxID=7064 RepID=A0AAW1IX35_POPJA